LLTSYARHILAEITNTCGGIPYLIDSILLTESDYYSVLKNYPDLIGTEPGKMKLCFSKCSIVGNTHKYKILDVDGNILKER
jgi:hypothetical protein